VWNISDDLGSELSSSPLKIRQETSKIFSEMNKQTTKKRKKKKGGWF
jgi:hypothetical protein